VRERMRRRTKRGGQKRCNQSSGMRRMSVHGMLLRYHCLA
jgi:hypothetical protein